MAEIETIQKEQPDINETLEIESLTDFDQYKDSLRKEVRTLIMMSPGTLVDDDDGNKTLQIKFPSFFSSNKLCSLTTVKLCNANIGQGMLKCLQSLYLDSLILINVYLAENSGLETCRVESLHLELRGFYGLNLLPETAKECTISILCDTRPIVSLAALLNAPYLNAGWCTSLTSLKVTCDSKYMGERFTIKLPWAAPLETFHWHVKKDYGSLHVMFLRDKMNPLFSNLKDISTTIDLENLKVTWFQLNTGPTTRKLIDIIREQNPLFRLDKD